MSAKNITTPQKAKSNKQRSISIPKVEFITKEKLNERGKSDNLLNSKVPDIPKIQKSQSPSPLLKQDVNDLLGVIQENPDQNMILQDGILDLSLSSPINSANQPFQSVKNEETVRALEKQLASIRSELNIKNSLIEKLMKENNDLKNELGVYMASVEDNKENLDTKNKQTNEKIKFLEEENKTLKNDNKLCQEQLLSKTTLVNELAEKIEDYHQNNKRSLEFFMSSFKSQMTEFMQDSQKQYNHINSSIQGHLRKARKDYKAQNTAQKEKVLKNQGSETKFTSSCSKAENRPTLAQAMGKNRKISVAVGYVVCSDQSDEEKSNAVLKNKADKNPKMQRHSYNPKRN